MTEETQAPGVVFNIQKIYVKDASYEAPNVSAVFLTSRPRPRSSSAWTYSTRR